MKNEKTDDRHERPKAHLALLEIAAHIENGGDRQRYSKKLLSIFDQAVEQLKTSGLHEEVGSLRYVLARLMNEEEDLNKLANNVARIVSVSIRTVQMHNEITGQSTSELFNQLTELLKELGGDLTSESTEGKKS